MLHVLLKYLLFYLKCTFYVLLKHLLLLYLMKLVRTNKLLSLSPETLMYATYFVKIFIIILSKEIDKNK